MLQTTNILPSSTQLSLVTLLYEMEQRQLQVTWARYLTVSKDEYCTVP